MPLDGACGIGEVIALALSEKWRLATLTTASDGEQEPRVLAWSLTNGAKQLDCAPEYPEMAVIFELDRVEIAADEPLVSVQSQDGWAFWFDPGRGVQVEPERAPRLREQVEVHAQPDPSAIFAPDSALPRFETLVHEFECGWEVAPVERDQRLGIAGSDAGWIAIFKVRGGEPLALARVDTLLPAVAPVSAAISHDGNVVAVASRDGVAVIATPELVEGAKAGEAWASFLSSVGSRRHVPNPEILLDRASGLRDQKDFAGARGLIAWVLASGAKDSLVRATTLAYAIERDTGALGEALRLIDELIAGGHSPPWLILRRALRLERALLRGQMGDLRGALDDILGELANDPLSKTSIEGDFVTLLERHFGGDVAERGTRLRSQLHAIKDPTGAVLAVRSFLDRHDGLHAEQIWQDLDFLQATRVRHTGLAAEVEARPRRPSSEGRTRRSDRKERRGRHER
jgi:hypothetical protein